jgi:NAD(P)-dependent dehydrogenase (short-subunit alcohol dehydrogenase family)
MGIQARKRFGPIDVLFVNAGVARFAPVEQITEAIYDRTGSILKGVRRC